MDLKGEGRAVVGALEIDFIKVACTHVWDYHKTTYKIYLKNWYCIKCFKYVSEGNLKLVVERNDVCPAGFVWCKN